MNPQEPLAWPDHYPPVDRWKRFFIGVRWLGPDLSFLKEFGEAQAKRTEESMNAWPNQLERRLAAVMGEAFVKQGTGWKTAFFIPGDSFGVILHGPRFQSVDDLASDSALSDIERRVGRTFPEKFWQRATQLTLGEMVHEMFQWGAAI